MYLLPALVAFIAGDSRKGVVAHLRPARLGLAWLFAWLLLTLLIGFRYMVGGDWGQYLNYLYDVSGLEIDAVLSRPDPGYQLLNWICSQTDLGIFGVNLVCGALFAYGLVVFCQMQPRPWLALAVAIPYMVTVVAMGYSRQGVALGLAMLGLVALSNESALGLVGWVILAATFHKTAVLLLPIAALAKSRNRYWTMAWVGLTAAVAAQLLLSNEAEGLITNYISAEYQSEGALVRLLMNALPAAALLIWRRRFLFSRSEASLWGWCAIISLVMFGLFFVTKASTALDRMALYMLPLQLVVFARAPDVFGTQGKRDYAQTMVAAILLYYGAVDLIWLNFSDYAYYWLPYRFYPLEDVL
jgi:EpsG family